MKQCCKTCKWYQESFSGECWVEPPRAMMVMSMNPLSGKPEPMKWTYFPQPAKQAIDKIRCGKYEPKLEVMQ